MSFLVRSTVAAMTAMLVVCAHAAAAGTAQSASKPKQQVASAKGQVGGIVVSNTMAGDTLVTKVQGDQARYRLRQEDDAAAFAKESKLKVGDLYCVQDDGG